MISAAEQPTLASEPAPLVNTEGDHSSPISQPFQPLSIVLEWRVFQGLKHPGKLAAVAFAVLATLGIGAYTTHSFLVGLLGASLLMASLKEFVLPLKFVLTSKSAKVTCLGIPCSEIEWADVKSVYKIRGGIKLSPMENPAQSRIEHIRGVVLNCPKDLRTEIEKSVQVLSSKTVQSYTELYRK